MKTVRRRINEHIGFGLIELLISLLLSGLLVLVGLEMWSIHGGLHHQLNALTGMHEKGRFTLHALISDIHMAGHALPGLNVSAIDLERTKEAGEGALSKDNDEISLVRISTENDYNCLGVPVVSGTQLDSHYYVKGNKLLCRATYWAYGSKNRVLKKSTAQTVIEGVDSFQILYGITLPALDGGDKNYFPLGMSHALAYVKANEIPANAEVSSILLGLVIKDEKAKFSFGNNVVESKVIRVLDRTYEDIDDGINRQTYETTVVLRNVPRYLGAH